MIDKQVSGEARLDRLDVLDYGAALASELATLVRRAGDADAAEHLDLASAKLDARRKEAAQFRAAR